MILYDTLDIKQVIDESFVTKENHDVSRSL